MKIFKRIKNFIRWFPLLIKDRDYDRNYLMQIILFKLNNMEEFFRKYGMCVGAEDRADIMKELTTIGSRILEDNYEWEIVEKYDLLDNRTDLAFAKEIATGFIVTKREYFNIKDKLTQERENDLDKFFSLLRTSYLDLWD